MAAVKQRPGARKDASGTSHLLDNKSTSSTTTTTTTTTEKSYSHPVKKSSLASWTFFLLFLTLLATISYTRHYALPTPVTQDRDPVTGKPQFSEANVLKLTEHLAGDIGLRLIGTEAVDETERYLMREIETLREQAQIEAAKGAGGEVGVPNFDVWVQVDDGSHRFDFMSK
ncbi:hypothetical protein BGZ98_003992, partial [Dissophora globulifera]